MRAQQLWLISLVVLLAAQAHATSVGVLCWRLSPNVDIVCFNVDNAPSPGTGTFALHGTLRGGNSYRYPVTGSLVVNEFSGLWEMHWVIYFNAVGNGGHAVFGGRLNTQSLQGQFFSSFGAQGTMIPSSASAAQSMDERQSDTDEQMLLQQTLEDTLTK